MELNGNHSLDEYPRHFPRSATVFAAVCAIVFSVVGVLGNLITVLALLRYARLRRHATTAFVISLSVSDLIFAGVNLPLTASRYLNEAWVLGETLCRIFPVFFYGNVAVSLLSMVAITVNRYVLISKSEIYARLYTPHGITAMLIAIWTLSFSLLIPPLVDAWGTLGLDAATFSCTILKKDGKSPKKFLFLLGIVVPCVSQRSHARQGLGREPPTVRIPGQGALLGKEVFLSRAQKVTAYLGIPYAQAPLGPLRFAAPVRSPLPSWTGTRDASRYRPSCQQQVARRKLHETLYLRLLPPDDQPDPGFSEDCLFLNVFVPDGARPPEGWPVMVWFHGGDFNTGTPAIWDASVFVTKQKVLVVTVAYRLNILGFFTTTDAEAPGNYGILDQLAALDWVRRNVDVFDGSPGNVAIAGHSSGAISVGLHLVSPLSRGLFSKAIAMSGDAVGSVGSPEAEESVVDLVAEKFGCYRRPTSALMECLRRVDGAILVRETADIETWGPIVDADTVNASEPFLPEHPRDALASGVFNAVPLVTGYANNEQALAYIEGVVGAEDGGLSLTRFEGLVVDEATATVEEPDENSTCESKPKVVADAVLFFYKPHPSTENRTLLRDRYLDMQTERSYASGLTFLAGKLAHRQQAYVYRFDYRPKTPAVTRDVPEWAGVPHMFDLQFLWGLPYALGSPVQWNAADKKIADTVMTTFANFLRTGTPSLPVPSSGKWEPYSEASPGILLIDRTVEMADPSQVDYKALAFWNEYYPSVLVEATNNCCNVTDAASTSYPGFASRLSGALLVATLSLGV
ncbi:fatty acyl-CoA hydrolase precursor, medium chain [Orussus abietinus]|uniref:fatty acyl-CoA hydrolase precursor, medium chain n=1 Tax=Orussus abietinus TaxID=222816 RepID=UPI000C715B4D|nr:fatty acyl-CoA hydrolase precursor, medium chain [Orussus abietinus]